MGTYLEWYIVFPYVNNGENDVQRIWTLRLIGSSSALLVNKKAVKSRMHSNSDQTGQCDLGLSALEVLDRYRL